MTSKRLGSKLVSLGLAATAAVAATTVSGSALADFGREGTLAIGAERLFGIVGTSTETEDVESDSTSISFMWGGGGERVYDRPRAAVDYFIIDSLSLGGSLGFYTWSEEVEDGPENDGSGFLFAPRVGYMLQFTDILGFWPRGGFTYVNDNVEDAYSDSATALSVEAPLVIGLGRELAITVGLTLDLGIGGEIETELPAPAADVDQEHTQFGIQVGLAGFL
jgi:hypothetical protein